MAFRRKGCKNTKQIEYENCSWAWEQTCCCHRHHTLSSHDQIQGRAATVLHTRLGVGGMMEPAVPPCNYSLCNLPAAVSGAGSDLGQVCCSITSWLCRYVRCCLGEASLERVGCGPSARGGGNPDLRCLFSSCSSYTNSCTAFFSR